MRKTFFLFSIVIFAFFFAGIVYAQLQTDSNIVRTRVGNPPSGPVLSGDIPTPPQDVRQGIISNFGITMNGFSNQHLTWAWEKFHETSNTRFPSLVRGVTIQATGGGSSQIGCAGSAIAVRLGQYTPGTFFKFILTHELGHVIQSCLPRSESKFNEAINAYYAEGGVSFYGNNANSCNGTVNVNENYADIIAYYLNPSAGLASGPASCGGPPNPPNPFFVGQTRFPLSFTAAEGVLQL